MSRIDAELLIGDADSFVIRPLVVPELELSAATERIQLEPAEIELMLGRRAEYIRRETVYAPAGSLRMLEHDFGIQDWALYAGRYHIEVPHSWETRKVYGYVLNERGEIVHPDLFENYSVNKVRIYVPAIPDLRFAGSLILFSKQSAAITLN